MLYRTVLSCAVLWCCREGEELTVSYTGPEGYTNQRLMAQYGELN
jgi:hypothetical protein